MRPSWATLNERERTAFYAVTEFLKGRLEERATVDWALRLKPDDKAKRLALLDLFGAPNGRKIGEPWLSGWYLIQESWTNPQVEDFSREGAYHVKHRLSEGDRSGGLVTTIVDLVSPRLHVKPFSTLALHYRQPPKRPKTVADLFSAMLTSGKVIDPDILDLSVLNDHLFLLALATELEGAIAKGLAIARRLGWDGEQQTWRLGQLHRVYYVPKAERLPEDHEPDKFHRGIAPSVKLLHAAASRLVDVDISTAMEFVYRWRVTNSPVHLRLWAAMSQDSRITPAGDVGFLLLSLDDRRFWDVQNYPEIAELRAKRFGELDSHDQLALTARIRKRPPRNQWPKSADAKRVANARVYWAVRELRRIEITGASIPQRDKAWLDAAIHEFPDLLSSNRSDEGFPRTPRARGGQPNPDSQYDLLSGEERLKALEAALASARGGWDDNPSKRARDWIEQSSNITNVLSDFESVPDGGGAFNRVWDWFGWHHSPSVKPGEDLTNRDIPDECNRILSLILKLPAVAARQAIDGISHWLSTWAQHVLALPKGPQVWLKLWPIAVEATNEHESIDGDEPLNTVVRSSSDNEPEDLDTLNTSVGKLVGVFLRACPNLKFGNKPFNEESSQRAMRNAIEESFVGPSGLIVKYRLIEHMPYFLGADKQWTLDKLVPPLLDDSEEARSLWRAVARQQIISPALMEILGESMADHAIDLRLGRETRRSLVFMIVVDCLDAFRDHRNPAVSLPRIQQMIRSLDGEVRVAAAEAIVRFVKEGSVMEKEITKPLSAEQLFQIASGRFLREVWPQERSLATPGVSQALSELPAASGNAFVEAMNTIERFLVPFDCWSVIDYGFYGDEDDALKLSDIDSPQKAESFLRLLDLTIGTAEGSVIPHDLSEALDQIREAAPKLEQTKIFRRLATAARRD